jgi:holo-[acyl-carrier protein] synthase
MTAVRSRAGVALLPHFGSKLLDVTSVSDSVSFLDHIFQFQTSIDTKLGCASGKRLLFADAASQMRLLFPLALRLGTDIIATNRILCSANPDSKRLTRLATRFLHPKELDDLNRRFPSWAKLESENDESKRRQIASWLAGRWAAKEAAKKAWNATLLSFRDLRVETEIGGGVLIVCDTCSADADSSPSDIKSKVTEQTAQLSISHDGDYTIATVIATPLHINISSVLATRRAEAEAKLVDKDA